jgi:alcohol dehydrogenase
MATEKRMMRAARMHEVGQPMRIDMVPRPVARSNDVVVEVKACGMVPNLGNVLANWPKWCPHLPQPKLPAIFGLDPVGVVSEVGDCVIGIRPGERVYVNPARSCSTCYYCLSGNRQNCSYFTFNGYFGFQPDSQRLFDMYPQGGFCEYMAAPQYAIAKLADQISFYEAARLGYIGTGYSALKKCGPLMGQSVLINGISGTLGVGTALCAIGMGATRILGTARNMELLERVRNLAPERIEIFSTESGSVAEWVKSRTGGKGADFMIDALGAMASLDVFIDAMHGLRRGGKLVNIGGTAGEVPIHTKWLMDEQIQLIGSVWFSTAEACELIEMARTKLMDLSVFQHEVAKLEDINDAISGVGGGQGGFRNYVIVP